MFTEVSREQREAPAFSGRSHQLTRGRGGCSHLLPLSPSHLQLSHTFAFHWSPQEAKGPGSPQRQTGKSEPMELYTHSLVAQLQRVAGGTVTGSHVPQLWAEICMEKRMWEEGGSRRLAQKGHALCRKKSQGGLQVKVLGPDSHRSNSSSAVFSFCVLGTGGSGWGAGIAPLWISASPFVNHGRDYFFR